MPERRSPIDQIDEILHLVRRSYPSWNDFDHPGFGADEISYKQDAAGEARELLGREIFEKLLREENHGEILARLGKVARATNLLYLGTPSSGDLAVLYAPELDQPGFCAAVFDLLYGKGESPERLDRFISYLDERSLPNRWTFPTYFLFLIHPETEFFVKPSVIHWFLKLANPRIVYTPRPSGQLYRGILELVRQLGKSFAESTPRDMIDLQSLLFVAYSAHRERARHRPSRTKVREFEELYGEFVRTYLGASTGAWHLGAYESCRSSGKKNYAAILEARKRGEDVTDRVLLELLPHADNAGTRDKGAWIHVAPAINGNLRRWFEASGWRKPDDWDKVAEAILEFLGRSVEDPEKIEGACSDFAALPWSKGFQTGMLTPILNALSADDFLLVNNKSRLLVNYLAGTSFSQKLTDYPAVNRAGQDLIGYLSDVLEGAADADASPADLFDAYSHWFVAVRKVPIGQPRYFKIAPGEGARLWDAWRDGGYAAIGWNELGDLTHASRTEFERRRDALLVKHDSWTPTQLEQVWQFLHVREGDRLVANQGTRRILGIGTVTGPYEYVAEDEYSHHLPVDWDDAEIREVQEPGWVRTLVELDEEKFRSLVEAPRPSGNEEPLLEGSGFSPRTFELLKELFQVPRKETYLERKQAFQAHVELPLQNLLVAVIERLPEPITAALETERSLFSRILKNDYGRGGAWPFYWGALYPKGGQRTADTQLFVWLNHDRLEAGFYIGRYGSDTLRRFLTQVARYRNELTRLLQPLLTRAGLVFGARESLQDPATGEFVTNDLDWQKWFDDPGRHGVDVRRIFRRPELLGMELDSLVTEIVRLFDDLFPLVLLSLEDEPLEPIRAHLGDGPDDEERELQRPVPLPDVAVRTSLDLSLLERWVRAIERKKQAIFYGPPGTGKTFAARQLAQHLVGGGDGFVDLVQFHPSYTYEEFIQGIRPEEHPGGFVYRLRKGRFLEFCDKARRATGLSVLIIDEINRAELSRVFGELMYLLEYREAEVPLAGGGKFSIPENVRILGTMNTADRSIALVDHALRRRFAFLRLAPEPEILRRFHRGNGFDVEKLVALLERLNGEIADPHYEVGVTFFLREGLDKEIEDVWRMEIEPYLEEYFFDQPEKVNAFRWDSVRTALAP